MAKPVKDNEELYSSYLQYLPAMYRDDDFTGRFLHIFEDIISPIENIIDNASYYFDPDMTPALFISWLSTWVGMVLDERWPELRRRQLIKSAVELYRWRGTRRGMIEHLKMVTGYTPEIIEFTPPKKRQTAAATQSDVTQPQESVELKSNCFSVTLTAGKKEIIDPEIVRAVIEVQKPAHTAYILIINTQ